MPIVSRGRQQGVPKNRTAVVPAQQALQTLAPVIQEQYQNALAVNGYPVLVFSRLVRGVACSCSKVIAESPRDLMSFDDNGVASPETVKAMTSGFLYEVNRYGTRSHTPNPLTQQFDETELDLNPKGREFHNGTVLNDPFAGRIDDQAQFPADVPLTLGADRCGICLTTGIVGGFSLFGGRRLILDYSAISSQDRIHVDQISRPYKIVFDEQDATVEFTAILPVGIYSVLYVRAFDNVEQVPATVDAYSGGLWSTFSTATAATFATGTPVRIRVTPTQMPFQITHLEISFLMSSKAVLAEYPRVTNTGDLSMVDAVEPVSLNLGPQLSDLAAYDCFYDLATKRLWRVSSVTDFYDKNRNPHGWDCQARFVQQYEVMSLLVDYTVSPNLYPNLPRRLA